MLVNLLKQVSWFSPASNRNKALLKTASLAYEAQLSKEELLEVTDKVRDASNSEITQAHVRGKSLHAIWG